MLGSYRLCREVRLDGIWDNASGATYNAEENTLWVVSRSPRKLFEYGLDGSRLREFELSAVGDPEGVAWMYGDRFAVLEEVSGVKEMQLLGGNWLTEAHGFTVGLPEWRSNQGLEGIAFDKRHDCFYAVQEKHEKRVLEITRSGNFKELFRGHHFGVGDLAGIYYSDATDSLFILSQESQLVLKVSRSGDVIETTNVNGYRPEGISFTPDGRRMFIVSEPNQLFVYSADEC